MQTHKRNREQPHATPPKPSSPEYQIAQDVANDVADLLAPQSGAYYDIWLDGEKFVSGYKEVRAECADCVCVRTGWYASLLCARTLLWGLVFFLFGRRLLWSVVRFFCVLARPLEVFGAQLVFSALTRAAASIPNAKKPQHQKNHNTDTHRTPR